MSEKFVSKAVSSIESCAGGNWGYIWDGTDNSETLRLDNLESEVVGGARGAADRGDISKNGSDR